MPLSFGVTKRPKPGNARKVRHTAIEFDMGEAVPINEHRLYRDGRIEMLYDGVRVFPKAVHIKVTYDRPKKPKVLIEGPVTAAAASADPNETLLRADRILWIDTNTRELDGQLIHTTAVIRGIPRRGTLDTIVELSRAEGIEFRGDVERPEAFGWSEVIERVRRRPRRLLNRRYCVVVDSDLGKLDAINRRQVPVWGTYLLPAAFQLVYASADVGREMLAPAVMRLCDESATEMFGFVSRLDPEGRYVREMSLVGSVLVRGWSPVDGSGPF